MSACYFSILRAVSLAFAILGTSTPSVVGMTSAVARAHDAVGDSNEGSDRGRSKKDKGRGKANGEGEAKPGQVGADCRIESSSVVLPYLPEASGLAASHRTPGILWSHLDSGAVPILFALDARGSLKGKVRVSGATLADWEDVAVGACGSSSCVYLADIGDNRGTRKGITVYRVPEPQPTDSATGSLEAFHAMFPDTPQDAEAFFVLGTDEMFIVTKGATGPVSLYRFPRAVKAGAGASTLQKVGVIQSGRVNRSNWVTGASASLDGRWVALRTHVDVTFYDASKIVKGDFGSPLKFDVSVLHEPQGEGVALGAKGSVFLVGEGGGKGAAGTFASLVCNLPE
jgi:hypothetical protein